LRDRTARAAAALFIRLIRYDLLFLELPARCFFAAFMLSTRLGYFRPAFFAAALAFALLFAVNFVCRLFLGAGFFHGAFFFVAGITDIP
jgi:hypothetical protein